MIPQGIRKQQKNLSNCMSVSPDQIGSVGLEQEHRYQCSTKNNTGTTSSVQGLHWFQNGASKEPVCYSIGQEPSLTHHMLPPHHMVTFIYACIR